MNNYDMSSTGENIQFWCHYDVDLAQIYFKDFFEHEATRLDWGRDCVMYLVGDSTKPQYTRSQLRKLGKEALFELCQFHELLYWDVKASEVTRSELEADLLNVSIEQHYKQLTREYGWHELANHIQHDFYVSRGYSQGEAVYIVSLDESLTNEHRKHFDRLLWDCPVSIRAEIGDKEFYEDSFMNDPYEWDVDEVKEKIKALPISDYAKGFLMDSLPDYPQYL